MQEKAAEVADLVRKNMTDSKLGFRAKTWKKIKEGGREYASRLLHADTILRWMDGWKPLGKAYQLIKQPIDDALNINRREKRAYRERLSAILKTAPTTEEFVVLLNSGTEAGRQALTDSGIDWLAVLNRATEADLSKAREVWALIDELWSRTETALRKKNGETPTKPKGDFYPLAFENEDRKGSWLRQFTDLGHSQHRQRNKGKPVDLSTHRLFNFLDNVIYELNLKEKLRDASVIIKSKDVKEAFKDRGREAEHKALELWIDDISTGQIFHTDFLNSFFRRIRTGGTVAALALNVANIILQPLGVIQAATVVGKWRIALAMLQYARALSTAQVFKLREAINHVSQLMEERNKGGFDRDFLSYRNDKFKQGWWKRGISRLGGAKVPVIQADFKEALTFYLTNRLQGIADTIIWMAAYDKHLSENPGAVKNAVRYADRVVVDTQGSGEAVDLSAIQRGTFSENSRQQELTKALTMFSTFMLAKTNLMVERARKPFHPKCLLKYASDIFLLYVLEAAIPATLMNSDFWDEEEEWSDALSRFAKEELPSIVAGGFPVAREVASALQGFTVGGPLATMLDHLTKAVIGSPQAFSYMWHNAIMDEEDVEEFDFGRWLKSAWRTMAIFFRMPGTGPANVIELMDREDRAVYEFILGPKWDHREE